MDARVEPPLKKSSSSHRRIGGELKPVNDTEREKASDSISKPLFYNPPFLSFLLLSMKPNTNYDPMIPVCAQFAVFYLVAARKQGHRLTVSSPEEAFRKYILSKKKAKQDHKITESVLQTYAKFCVAYNRFSAKIKRDQIEQQKVAQEAAEDNPTLGYGGL